MHLPRTLSLLEMTVPLLIKQMVKYQFTKMVKMLYYHYQVGKLRLSGNSSNGIKSCHSVSGWEAETEWQDFIPFDELPRVVNPDKGFIATANNKIAGDDYPYHISNVWAQPYRYERIYEVLESNDELTLQDMEDLQMDPTNLRAREFVP